MQICHTTTLIMQRNVAISMIITCMEHEPSLRKKKQITLTFLGSFERRPACSLKCCCCVAFLSLASVWVALCFCWCPLFFVFAFIFPSGAAIFCCSALNTNGGGAFFVISQPFIRRRGDRRWCAVRTECFLHLGDWASGGGAPLALRRLGGRRRCAFCI